MLGPKALLIAGVMVSPKALSVSLRILVIVFAISVACLEMFAGLAEEERMEVTSV